MKRALQHISGIKGFIWGLIFVSFASCGDSGDDFDIIKVNREIYTYMKDIYLWNDKLPEVNYSDYNTPRKFMDALCYKPLDKWSVAVTLQDFNRYFEEGSMIGHGFLVSSDETGNVRIASVYRSTKAYLSGVRRGWIIKSINGSAATPDNATALMGKRELGLKNDFEFINGQGQPVTFSLVKEEVAITPVLHYDTLHWEGSIIGYMVFQDFIDAAKEEIDETFAYFKAAGIQELIIDLRYNGGGSVPVAEYLSGWLLGSRHSGKPLVKFIHNNNNHQYDTTVNIPANPNAADLDRIFFIGTQGTASASELIINGIKPYVQSILAGEPTHGKPVGMYGIYLQSADYVILPVSFKYTNGEDEGDFYNGLVPDLPVPDDITRDFGDKDEDCLESVLHYISTGVASYTGKKSTHRLRYLIPQDAMGEYLKAF